MLDIKRIRNNLDEIKAAMARRGEKDFDLDAVVALDEKRRELLQQVELMKNEQNTVSKEVPKLKKEGKDATEVMARMKELSGKIKELDGQVKEVEDQLEYTLLRIPNVPHPDVPQGETDDDNIEVRKWSEPTHFDFEPKAHWDIATDLGIIDFEAASKITGARFALYKGVGARLERALINFMLDLHIEEHGYTEVLPPFMVNRSSMTGTGQLPKFEEDAFKLPQKDYFLVPTAEVPVTNMHRDEIIEGANLPLSYVAYTPCFRSEAGSAGRDTRGLIRQHQFNKVELVKFVKPEDSYAELEKLTNNAEKVLQLLEIPYRIVRICTGDLGFTAAFKYDIEVWMPSYNRYVEISSCSNFEDFQARRANIRYRPEEKGKVEFLHTLNGSGLAVGRTVAAILENCQDDEGNVKIPEALIPYMRGIKVITK
ncbi:serine--tRNA ligase [Alkaliphilus oremlandii]|uniref:Serine--tRNA ligase n=1 Tax=Alkaliphilus oremlandii (strain OhILAs) TaxID=350688 RepID=SYS_ALKOO|nr:serine--tRNA ligase [Alkaliphilus oremlandii]A8MEB3.1 RecName: Full=Serine--tRNA ligase; AltName: Full=Seryl-tRNA synthetase; Short=SerRS; AltName: Full=Seryl-tRNA(Ser/Sec) synthetase [Alkaliphilus oremlandii OhILAs]ABW17584.1 seryl-tRNA synthetase [Alkaliphilus oremlandii OhILAs]